MILYSKTEELIENYLKLTKDTILHCLSSLYLESPIEQIFATGLITHGHNPVFSARFNETLSLLQSGNLPPLETWQDSGFVWTSQFSFNQYRADFAFVFYSELISYKKVIVECDGHEFHEKTKEQAAKDKKRDRYFQQNGWQILHFTGSEIYENPRKCIYELLNIYDIPFCEAITKEVERRRRLEGEKEDA